ncbi:MAG: Tm-1-like ATP-binding domain-containing protein [Gaiella sp.]
MTKTVVLVGTLDTKGHEYAYLADRIREQGVDVVLIDAGIVGEPLATPDITREDVAAAVGADVGALASAGDRGTAVETMARGAAKVVKRLHGEGKLDAIGGLGGSGGSAIATYAMRQLPIGVPKLMVSTVASGDTTPYVGSVDVTMMYSVVDIAGVNSVSARIMGNAAAALAGMARATVPALGDEKPIVVASMFGVTTPAVTTARERLEELGYEVLVFHQTGAGGGSMEKLLEAGYAVGSLDVTTTEFCDQVAGGVLVAVPERLESAGKAGIPQVVSLGALDMVNFGPRETVPERYADRNLYVHNPTITLMRTTPGECREIGSLIAEKLNAATGPTELFIPLRGVSTIATEGGVFHDPEADEALFSTLRERVDRTKVTVHELDADVNDEAFARAMADRLHELIEAAA